MRVVPNKIWSYPSAGFIWVKGELRKVQQLVGRPNRKSPVFVNDPLHFVPNKRRDEQIFLPHFRWH